MSSRAQNGVTPVSWLLICCCPSNTLPYLIPSLEHIVFFLQSWAYRWHLPLAQVTLLSAHIGPVFPCLICGSLSICSLCHPHLTALWLSVYPCWMGSFWAFGCQNSVLVNVPLATVVKAPDFGCTWSKSKPVMNFWNVLPPVLSLSQMEAPKLKTWAWIWLLVSHFLHMPPRLRGTPASYL